MNPGQNPSSNRATTRTAPAKQLAGDVGFLSLRLERLCKSLKLFARYCDQAPAALRGEVKQYLDLAGIELAEAQRILMSPVDTAGSENEIAAQQMASEVSQVEWTVHSTQTEAPQLEQCDDTASAEDARIFNDPLLDVAQNGHEANFDSLAEQAEVPEANDVEAILARLKISIENADAGDPSESASTKSKPADARELLLGFEVCKLEPSESEPDLAAAESCDQVNDSGGAHSVPAAPGMNDESNSWFPSVSAELLAGFGAEESHANNPPESSSEAAIQDWPASLNQAAGDSVSELPAASVEQTVGENRISSSSHSKHEQSENSSPLQSISPENLKQILELKEELNELLVTYKSPQSTPQSP